MVNDIIQVKNLKKSFSGKTVLNGLSFNLREGEFVSLLGPSGCGKTVTLKLLVGLLKNSSGEIIYNFPDKDGINISLAFQKIPLFPWLNLEENIKICMNIKGLSEDKKKEILLEYLQRARLEKFAKYYPYQISGGMAQKVNVIRCFASGSPLILMDEPFVFLDFIQRTGLQKFTLDVWQREKKTIFFVTHNMHEAIILSDRILIMSGRGEIKKEFNVGIPRPRDVNEVRKSPEYISLLGRINEVLSEEIGESAGVLHA